MLGPIWAGAPLLNCAALPVPHMHVNHLGQLRQDGWYGTRSQTALAVWRDGRAELHERYRPADGAWRTVHHSFMVQALGTEQAAGNGGGTGQAACR